MNRSGGDLDVGGLNFRGKTGNNPSHDQHGYPVAYPVFCHALANPHEENASRGEGDEGGEEKLRRRIR
jgi:hypothetical protein